MPYYRFTGKELDPETGLYYYGARYYDPVLSRWISADPILGKYLPTGSKDSDNNLPGVGGVYRSVNINLYHYGLNNPLRYVDPTGQFSAETGGKYDRFQSSNIQTGDWFVNDVLTEVNNVSGYLLNTVLNGLGGMGEGLDYAVERAHWLVTDVLGGSEGDFEALALRFALSGGSLSQSGRLSSAAKIGTEVESSAVSSGTKVYRIWGNEAKASGRSWTTVDPRTVPNYRNAAGLPKQNTGRFLSEGTLSDTRGVSLKSADPLHGNAGGLPEVVVPKPESQIMLENVQGLNPEF